MSKIALSKIKGGVLSMFLLQKLWRCRDSGNPQLDEGYKLYNNWV
ncbi:hypothetical protein LX99_04222 [Mucilaginibacter oryzae]|uniref:Uncharacterized protein n=1 Tax=Mucilaginibacter oryzae TaxID=468058 RepID=A0A316H0Q6_9SPHI|nr:hypothetical protein LX99_04222 [Mucilaginibacter oryzae]